MRDSALKLVPTALAADSSQALVGEELMRDSALKPICVGRPVHALNGKSEKSSCATAL